MIKRLTCGTAAVILLLSGAFVYAASSADGSGVIVFHGEKYSFGHRSQTLVQRSVEYIRPFETMQNWTQMLAARVLPYADPPEDYARAVAASVLFYNSDARAVVLDSPKPGQTLFTYQRWDPKDPSFGYEMHLILVNRGTDGLVLHEFVYRSLAVGPDALIHFREAIKAGREAWEKEILRATWPLPASSPDAAAAWNATTRDFHWYIHSPHVFVERKLVDAPFSLWRKPAPPEHAWLYVRSSAVLTSATVPLFIEAARAVGATGLDLRNQPAVTDSMLAQINEKSAGWPLEPGWRRPIDGLRYLNIKGTSVTDAGASELARMTPLQVLIADDQLTDAGLRTVATALVNLVKLRPGGPKITDAGLESFKGLRGLHRLDLSDTTVTEKGLRALKTLPLVQVNLPATVGNEGLRALQAIPTLIHIEMAKTHASDRGVADLKIFTKLHTLFIGAQLDDEGAKTLAQIPSLRRLDATGSSLTDAGLKTLGALSELEELALTRTKVTDQGLDALLGMHHLRFLEVSGTAVTLKGLGRLTALQDLDVISFSSTGELKLGDLLPLGNLRSLRTVIVNGEPLKASALQYLRSHAAPLRAWFQIDTAWADGDMDLAVMNDGTDVSHLVDKSPGSSGIKDEGLRRIHDVESDLDHVIPDVAAPQIAEQTDTAQNFLGEFTVNSGSAKSK